MKWIKLYCQKWFMGSTRWELTAKERAVWIDCLARAGLNDPAGQIDFYTFKQIADQFQITTNFFQATLQKFVKLEKIVFDGENCIKICNWFKYQSEYQRQEPYRNQRVIENNGVAKNNIKNIKKVTKNNIKNDIKNDIKTPTSTSRSTSRSISLDIDRLLRKGGPGENNNEEKIPYAEIIEDLNLQSGKHYRVVENTKKLIKARWDEKFTLKDFKSVHLNMSSEWKNDPKMNQYLRPNTLYSASKFEGYLNLQTPKNSNDKAFAFLDKEEKENP